MKSSTAKNKYLSKVKSKALRLNEVQKVIKENNIDIYDEYLHPNYYHLRQSIISLKSDIHWFGFKYRLEVQIPRSKN